MSLTLLIDFRARTVAPMESPRALLARTDPDVHEGLLGEARRQRRGLELIPSENYTYPEVLAVRGSGFTNKHAEGYPGRRYYGGQEFTDAIEDLARTRACALFRCEHANVQPLSGSPMNQAVYLGLLEPGDAILAMDLSHGGHLTHGAPVSHMGRLFRFVRYRTHPDDRGRMAEHMEQHKRGVFAEAEFRVVRPDGSVRWLRSRAYPVNDPAGRPSHFAGLAEDEAASVLGISRTSAQRYWRYAKAWLITELRKAGSLEGNS